MDGGCISLLRTSEEGRWDPTGEFELAMGAAKLHLRARMHTLALKQVLGRGWWLIHLQNCSLQNQGRQAAAPQALMRNALRSPLLPPQYQPNHHAFLLTTCSVRCVSPSWMDS